MLGWPPLAPSKRKRINVSDDCHMAIIESVFGHPSSIQSLSNTRQLRHQASHIHIVYIRPTARIVAPVKRKHNSRYRDAQRTDYAFPGLYGTSLARPAQLVRASTERAPPRRRHRHRSSRRVPVSAFGSGGRHGPEVGHERDEGVRIDSRSGLSLLPI